MSYVSIRGEAEPEIHREGEGMKTLSRPGMRNTAGLGFYWKVDRKCFLLLGFVAADNQVVEPSAAAAERVCCVLSHVSGGKVNAAGQERATGRTIECCKSYTVMIM